MIRKMTFGLSMICATQAHAAFWSNPNAGIMQKRLDNTACVATCGGIGCLHQVGYTALNQQEQNARRSFIAMSKERARISMLNMNSSKLSPTSPLVATIVQSSQDYSDEMLGLKSGTNGPTVGFSEVRKAVNYERELAEATEDVAKHMVRSIRHHQARRTIPGLATLKWIHKKLHQPINTSGS